MQKDEKVVLAHLQHLKDYNESEFLQQALSYIAQNNIINGLQSLQLSNIPKEHTKFLGSASKSFKTIVMVNNTNVDTINSSSETLNLTSRL